MNATEASRHEWNAGESPSLELINCGSFQRIASGVEAMARGHVALAQDRDFWKRQAENERLQSARLARSNAALRGLLRKLKATTAKRRSSPRQTSTGPKKK